MKIAVVNWNDRKIGGAESYLADLLPVLLRSGEDLAFWCEVRDPEERESVVPPGVPSWCAEEIGRSAAFAELRAWSPDLLYVHGLTDPDIEAELQTVAPGIFFAHNYYGTCITGAKTVNRPDVLPCGRRFGWGCLAHFYPQRCGGRSPITMWNDFRVQSKRLELLAGYRAVLCASEHMRAEYVRHGLSADRVRVVRYPIEGDPSQGRAEDSGRGVPAPGRPWRILCAGRLERQKGGRMLLDALPIVRGAVNRPLEVIFAGEGAERPALQQRAAELTARDPGLRIEFTGWMATGALQDLMGTVDLLALPSVWPEPFGMIGVEAGLRGVPAAAFSVGGIPDWLEHSVNGLLAPASPPTAEGFAAAVIGCLDPGAYPGLSARARPAARRFSMDAHFRILWEVLHGAGPDGAPGAAPALARS